MLRIGVIGTGDIAKYNHIPNYKKHMNDVEIVAIADCNEEVVIDCAKEHSISQYFTDYKQMLASMNLDAVSICLPNKYHCESVLFSLNAGCHVLCEKPPGLNWQEARKMEEEATKTGKILMYDLQFRLNKEVQVLKKFVKNGELGHIYYSKVCWMRRRGIPNWGNYTNKEVQGGGALIDLGIHILDTVLYLLDYPDVDLILGNTYDHIGRKEGVGLYGKWDWKSFNVEDMAIGLIQFKNGTNLFLETSFAANIENDEVVKLSLMGDKGGAELFPLKVYKEQYQTLLDITPTYLPKKNNRELLISNFVQSCLNKATPIIYPSEGTKLQRIIDTVYKSSERKDRIKYSQEKFD